MTSSSPSVALVGAGSLLGREIVQQLAATGLPSDCVALLDLEELANILTEYGDEARVMVDTATDDLLQHDVVCFCGDRFVAAEHLSHLLKHDRTSIDCTGAWLERSEVCVWLPGTAPAPSLAEHRAIALPSAAAMLLGTTLSALGEASHDAVATILLPASDDGEPGIQELSQQSTAVMNIDGIDQEVFGRQRAFDLWPAGDESGAQRVSNELGNAGLPVPRLTVIAAPVFHGTSAALFLPGANAAAVEQALRGAGIPIGAETEDGSEIDSPVRAAGTSGVHAAAIRDDAGGAWAWMVIDNLNARAAAAVAAIHAVLGPMPPELTATV